MATAPHARHDLVRIAASVDRRADADASAPGIRSVLADCEECRRLRADLLVLTAVLASSGTPPRPRDFTLDQHVAHRLRHPGLRGWWHRVGTARDSVTRPLAVGFTTLGLAGLLVAAVPVGGLGVGGAASDPSPERLVTATDDVRTMHGSGQGQGDGYSLATPAAVEPEGSPAPASPFVVLSWSFLTAGGGLFVVRRLAPGRRMR